MSDYQARNFALRLYYGKTPVPTRNACTVYIDLNYARRKMMLSNVYCVSLIWRGGGWFFDGYAFVLVWL